MKTPKRNPCPFCGEPRRIHVDHMGLVFWVACRVCHAMGPSAGSREEAIALWNGRGKERNHGENEPL